MRAKIIGVLCATVILILLSVSFLLFKQNLAYKNIIGDFATRTIWHANNEVEKTIGYLEANNFNEKEVKEHLDYIMDFGIHNKSFNLEFSSLLMSPYNSRRICEDEAYRNYVMERLRRIGGLTSYILKNSEVNREEHYTYKYRKFLGDDYSSIIYYDYLRKNKNNLYNMINSIKKS